MLLTLFLVCAAAPCALDRTTAAFVSTVELCREAIAGSAK
jgi:hypothetical protein